jgi:hypothetical protein
MSQYSMELFYPFIGSFRSCIKRSYHFLLKFSDNEENNKMLSLYKDLNIYKKKTI